MIEYHPHPTDPTLVVLKTTPRYIAKHSDEDLQAAVLAEREACALLCEEASLYFEYDRASASYAADYCAKEIIKRGNHEQD
jgi:hypothetical protein